MSEIKIVFRVTLPAEVDPDAFEAFMTDRYFPAVHRGPTRIGVITGLSLWRHTRSSKEPARTFLMEYGFSGILDDRLPRVDDETVLADFEKTYSAYFEPLGPFRQSTARSEDSPSEAPAETPSETPAHVWR